VPGRGKVGKDDDVLAFVVGGDHVQHHGAMIVEGQLDGVAAVAGRVIDDGGFGQVRFSQERLALDGEGDAVARDQHGAGGDGVGSLPLDVEADGRLLFFGTGLILDFPERGAPRAQGQAGQGKIDVEGTAPSLHSALLKERDSSKKVKIYGTANKQSPETKTPDRLHQAKENGGQSRESGLNRGASAVLGVFFDQNLFTIGGAGGGGEAMGGGEEECKSRVNIDFSGDFLM